MTRSSLRQAGQVSSANNFGLDDPVLHLCRGKTFVFTEKSIPAGGPTKPSFQMVPGVFHGDKAAGVEVDQ